MEGKNGRSGLGRNWFEFEGGFIGKIVWRSILVVLYYSLRKSESKFHNLLSSCRKYSGEEYENDKKFHDFASSWRVDSGGNDEND